MVSRRDDFLGGRRTMKPSRRSCENASSDCEEEIFCMGSSCSSLCPSILVLIAVLLLVLCHSANLQIRALVARLSARYLKQTRSLFSPRGGGERGCRRGITAQSLSFVAEGGVDRETHVPERGEYTGNASHGVTSGGGRVWIKDGQWRIFLRRVFETPSLAIGIKIEEYMRI